MGQQKGMRWSTAVAVVAQGVEAHLARKRSEVARGSELLQLLQTIDPPAVITPLRAIPTDATRPGFASTGKPEPGSIPDRVLEIVGEFDGPCSMAQILNAKHGAKHYLIRTAIAGLVKNRHLVATGSTVTRRYELPGIKRARRA